MKTKNIKIYQNAICLEDINETNREILSRVLLTSFMGNKPEQEDFDTYYKQVSEIKISEQDDLNLVDDLEICEYIFHIFNMDDRPDGQIFRSMSTGDIVGINDKLYLCQSIGFEKINLNLDKVQSHINMQKYDSSLINKFTEVEVPIKIKQPKDYSLTKKDVWGDFDVHSGKKISNGMIIARYNGICPIFKDIVPYKSVTVLGPLDKQDEIEYWLDYVNGGMSISKTKIIDNDKVAIRSDYMCW